MSKPQKKILVVEDELALQEHYQELLETLEDFDIKVDIAPDGLLGFLETVTTTYDLIISDITMPNVSGDELILEVVNNAKTKNTPIIVISGYIDEKIERKFKNIPTISLFQKPIQIDDFFKKVKEILNT